MPCCNCGVTVEVAVVGPVCVVPLLLFFPWDYSLQNIIPCVSAQKHGGADFSDVLERQRLVMLYRMLTLHSLPHACSRHSAIPLSAPEGGGRRAGVVVVRKLGVNICSVRSGLAILCLGKASWILDCSEEGLVHHLFCFVGGIPEWIPMLSVSMIYFPTPD